MTNYSRGPWVVTNRFQDKIDIHHAEPTKVGASSLVVARVTCRDTWREEQEANARLIAASPELLEALIAARAELQTYHASEFGEDYNNPRMNAVIDKATGETDV